MDGGRADTQEQAIGRPAGDPTSLLPPRLTTTTCRQKSYAVLT